jgi:hypothetical protein
MIQDKVRRVFSDIDVEKILEGYFKALDFIMAEIYNLEMPFIDDAVDIK